MIGTCTQHERGLGPRRVGTTQQRCNSNARLAGGHAAARFGRPSPPLTDKTNREGKGAGTEPRERTERSRCPCGTGEGSAGKAEITQATQAPQEQQTQVGLFAQR